MTVMNVASAGSRQEDGRVQALEKRGFVDGPLVVQLAVVSWAESVMGPGMACVWLTHEQARELGRQLLALAPEGER